MANDIPPPPEVFAEFLQALSQTVIATHDRIVPVLRGSALLYKWFGQAARQAADLDLEWFPQGDWARRVVSPIDHARNLCMHALGNHSYQSSPIAFDAEMPIPADGVNMWEYGTPGVRCYTGWTWTDRNLRGILQVDIAQAGSYDLSGIATETIDFPRAAGDSVPFLAYTPEMLLAAKLSWIVRHLQRSSEDDEEVSMVFRGEPKDLFDAHLILTQGRLRSALFQDAFLAVAVEDKLEWNKLGVLFGPGIDLPQDVGFPTWAAFSARYQELIHESPTEMLRTVIAYLGPLWGDLRLHLPFLGSIMANSVDEAIYLIYADWLEERGDRRVEFLRLFSRYFFHADNTDRAKLARSLSTQPVGWLYHVLGGPERSRDIRKRVEAS